MSPEGKWKEHKMPGGGTLTVGTVRPEIQRQMPSPKRETPSTFSILVSQIAGFVSRRHPGDYVGPSDKA